MSDYTLLEYASKAVGYSDLPIEGWTLYREKGMRLVDREHEFVRYWNPLLDDGDALRLAVKLKLSIESDALIEVDYIEGIGCEYAYGCEVWIVFEDASAIKLHELYNDNVDAATRRAIVRVAAAIGEKYEFS